MTPAVFVTQIETGINERRGRGGGGRKDALRICERLRGVGANKPFHHVVCSYHTSKDVQTLGKKK